MPGQPNLLELTKNLKGMLVMLHWQEQLLYNALDNLNPDSQKTKTPKTKKRYKRNARGRGSD